MRGATCFSGIGAPEVAMPDVDWMRTVFSYDADTGVLIWRERSSWMFSNGRDGQDRNAAKWNARFAGKEAGSIQAKGYRVVMLGKRPWLAHRLIWAMVSGQWPPKDMQIDHINHDRADNRLRNLRLVSAADNSRNKAATSNGAFGIYWRERLNKWEASIRAEGRTIYLGVFDLYEDALSTRREAERAHGFHLNHGRTV